MLIEEESYIYNYVGYDFQREYDNAFEEYSMEAYDEYLEEYVEKANDEARDILLDLCSDAEHKVFKLKDKLNEVNLILNRSIRHIIYEYYKVVINEEIDNTK